MCLGHHKWRPVDEMTAYMIFSCFFPSFPWISRKGSCGFKKWIANLCYICFFFFPFWHLIYMKQEKTFFSPVNAGKSPAYAYEPDWLTSKSYHNQFFSSVSSGRSLSHFNYYLDQQHSCYQFSLQIWFFCLLSRLGEFIYGMSVIDFQCKFGSFYLFWQFAGHLSQCYPINLLPLGISRSKLILR